MDSTYLNETFSTLNPTKFKKILDNEFDIIYEFNVENDFIVQFSYIDKGYYEVSYYRKDSLQIDKNNIYNVKGNSKFKNEIISTFVYIVDNFLKKKNINKVYMEGITDSKDVSSELSNRTMSYLYVFNKVLDKSKYKIENDKNEIFIYKL